MAMLETPSRIWRRIEAVEGKDMPSLPSLPDFDDSAESEQISNDGPEDDDFSDICSPVHSDPPTNSPIDPTIHSPIHSTPAAASTPTTAISPTPSTSGPNRRRSFLLSVINSTARPRFKVPTPHPRHNMFESRVPSPSPSVQGSADGPSRWQTPTQRPADKNAGDRASFISTASSHDLTTHHRVNTSFDPAMGLGAQGYGLGRFNAGKLNSYLHGLNRRLQEENEGLADRLKRVQEGKTSTTTAGRRSSAGARRTSLGGTGLGDVEEDIGGEGWFEEKAELEDMVDAFNQEVQRCMSEKEDVEKALEEEREGRMRDKDKWKERMREVEQGVEAIVKELEEKLREAERRAKVVDEEREEQARSTEKMVLEIEAERDFATDRAEKAEQALESGKAPGGELREANVRVGTDMGDLRNANAQIKDLEREVLSYDGRIDELEKELTDEQEMRGHLEQELQIKVDELAAAQGKINSLEAEARDVDEGIRADAEKASELGRQMEAALEAAEEKMLADGEELASLKASKINNTSGISPIHRQALSMSMRAPRTPGAPLRDMSWLNNTSADPTVSPLIAEISRLQRELDNANESIDDKLDKLEDAGLGVVGLTQQLEDARKRMSNLEEEISRLSRREDRRMHHLERARCQKCHVKVDLRGLFTVTDGDESSFEMSGESLSSDPPTPPTKTSEALRANLQSVNRQLDVMRKQWETEKQQLVGEKAVLQDAAHRLNVQVLNAKDEVKRVVETEKASEQKRAGVQQELDKVKHTMADLEADLESERANLRALTAERGRVQRDKEDVLLQLQRTESDMEDVKKQLQEFKQENRDLETELRSNANANQKARLLEVRVAETVDTIEELRQERSLLSSDHRELQQRFSEISERANKLRDEYLTSQTSHDNRRHQLDLHRVEIDDLHRALADQAKALQRTEEEKTRIAAEKSDVAQTVAALQGDLQRVRQDAESLGRDLKLLRAEKSKLDSKQKEELSKAERTKRQNQTQMRLLNEQLESQQQKALQAAEELKNHVCVIDQHQLSALKVQHNRECKGLMVQIRYLKAKFTREASLRCDLGYQKQYMLVLLSRYEKSEQSVLAAIARIKFPAALPPAKTRSLKHVVLGLIFILRAKHASEVWREQSALKEDIAAALQEVRSRRTAPVS